MVAGIRGEDEKPLEKRSGIKRFGRIIIKEEQQFQHLYVQRVNLVEVEIKHVSNDDKG